MDKKTKDIISLFWLAGTTLEDVLVGIRKAYTGYLTDTEISEIQGEAMSLYLTLSGRMLWADIKAIR